MPCSLAGGHWSLYYYTLYSLAGEADNFEFLAEHTENYREPAFFTAMLATLPLSKKHAWTRVRAIRQIVPQSRR